MRITTIIIFIAALDGIRFQKPLFQNAFTFANVISILPGAILRRAVVGARLFFCNFSAFLFSMVHRLFAWLNLRSDTFGRLVKGDRTLICKEGKFIRSNTDKCLITDKELEEEMREEINKNEPGNGDQIYVERSGRIGVIKK